VPAGERVADAVLLQVVAGRHLAAEAVAPVLDRHQRRRVWRRLHQDRHVQVGHPERVRNAPLVAEVGQRHDDAVDRVPVPPEEVGARPRLGPRLDGAVLRVVRPEHDDFDPRLLQDGAHLLAAGLGQVIGEEAPVADDQSDGHKNLTDFRLSALGPRLWALGDVTRDLPRAESPEPKAVTAYPLKYT
jgi:hypothetical protein